MPRCPQCGKLMDASETRCPFCREPVSWEKKTAIKELEPTGPVGRGGWLIAVFVYLLLSLPFMGLQCLGYLSIGNRLISGLCGLYVLYAVMLIILYFIRHRLFRSIALFVQALHLAAIVAITVDGILREPASLGNTLTLGILFALIIAGVTVYLIKSKRVKNTF
ncbi:MAG: hypothetical protein GX549_02845 [Clostridiales bacterium]|nr:hypothetical protein [Clostridiales bacterium]